MTTPGASPSRVIGSVAEFDDHVGLGTVIDADGRRHLFHCAQIADGTRSITTAVAVDYLLAPAHGGRWEAVDVRRRDGCSDAGQDEDGRRAPRPAGARLPA